MEEGILNEAVTPELLEAVGAWWEAKWSQAYQNKLPDAAFLWIHPDYKSGKSSDKSLRKLPYQDENADVDLPHVRNALARLETTEDIPDEAKKKIRAKLEKFLAAEDKKKKKTTEAKDLLIESTFADATLVEGAEHTYDVTLIKPGWSKNGRYYPGEVLASGVEEGVFNGTRAYVDHPPRAQRGEPRSVRDLAGEYGEAYVGDGGEVKTQLKIFEPVSEWLGPLIESAGHLIGLSIRANGAWRVGEAEGRRGDIVEQLTECISTDIVAEPAAGGGFDAMIEAFGEGKLADKIDAEKRKEEYWKVTSALRQIFDDVVDGKAPTADLESALDDFDTKLKSLAGGMFAPSAAEAIMEAKLVEENRTLREKNAAYEKAEAEAKAARVVDEALAGEAKMTEMSKARVREKLRGVDEPGKIAEAIADEKKYLAEARKGADPGAGGPKGAGAQEADQRKAGLERLQGRMDEAFGVKAEAEEGKPASKAAPAGGDDGGD